MQNAKYSFWRLLGHSVLPSISSLVGSAVTALAFSGLHIFLLSLRADGSSPTLLSTLSEYWVQLYHNSVIQPLSEVLSNPILNTVVVGLLWGLLGWGVYALLEFIIGTIREIRSSEDEVSLNGSSQLVRHPLRRLLITRLLWRLCIGVLVIGVSVALEPLATYLFGQDNRILNAGSLLDVLKYLGIVVLGWTAIFHIYIVLLRLFVFRTRLFGEILY